MQLPCKGIDAQWRRLLCQPPLPRLGLQIAFVWEALPHRSRTPNAGVMCRGVLLHAVLQASLRWCRRPQSC